MTVADLMAPAPLESIDRLKSGVYGIEPYKLVALMEDTAKAVTLWPVDWECTVAVHVEFRGVGNPTDPDAFCDTVSHGARYGAVGALGSISLIPNEWGATLPVRLTIKQAKAGK